MNAKKMPGREILNRAKIKSIPGGIIAVPVPRRNRFATAVSEIQGDGRDAETKISA
jgi:hypothetical protein